MNNIEALKLLIKDKEDNKQYFEDIEEVKNINGAVEQALSNYKHSVQKVMSMVNVTKIIDLDIQIGNGYSTNYHIVLSNQGLRSRYISSNSKYISQSSDLDLDTFAKKFEEALKIIFNHPEISTVQKNKILPLKTIDVKFLLDIKACEHLDIEEVNMIDVDMEIDTKRVSLPRFSLEKRYQPLHEFTLLSMRTQIEPHILSFLTERRATLAKIAKKKKELEKLFPIIFLFDGQ